MCGRFALFTPPVRLARLFQASLADDVAPGGAPSWNVAPTDQVLGMRRSRSAEAADPGRVERVIDAYRWGLVPSWAKDLSAGSRLCNARAEGIATKPSFRAAFETRRLVVPADGFYEWHTERGGRRPHYFTRSDGHPIAFAGLWEGWRDPEMDGDGPWLHSCTIVTTTGGADMDGIHDRMPVVLEAEALDRWLDPENDDVAGLQALLRPAPPGTLTHHPADPRVGNVRNNDPALIEAPADGSTAEQQSLL